MSHWRNEINQIIHHHVLPSNATQDEWKNFIKLIMNVFKKMKYDPDYGMTAFSFQPDKGFDEIQIGDEPCAINVFISRMNDGGYAIQPHDWYKYPEDQQHLKEKKVKNYDIDMIINLIKNMERDRGVPFKCLTIFDEIGSGETESFIVPRPT